MNQSDITTLLAYDRWANARLWTALERLALDQFIAPTTFTYGSLRGTLGHVLAASHIWRQRMQFRHSPTSLMDVAPFATPADLRAQLEAEEQGWADFAAGLSAEALLEVIEYKSTKGQPFTNRLDQVITHMLFHGMQHRAEAAAMLTDFGASPGDLDFILFMREREGQTR